MDKIVGLLGVNLLNSILEFVHIGRYGMDKIVGLLGMNLLNSILEFDHI
jgi:hypothetical protein